MSVDWVGYGYAALVASGGVIGYVKAGSVPSLAAGLLFGGLAGFGAYQISNDPNNIWVSLGCHIRSSDRRDGKEVLRIQEVHASRLDGRSESSDGGKAEHGLAAETSGVLMEWRLSYALFFFRRGLS
ncbi:hypothetical protein L3Q82_018021, partial [Scortum barcoo]